MIDGIAIDHDHPANIAVLLSLRQAARLRTTGDSSYDLDEYETRTHPDLVDRLYEIEHDLPDPCFAIAYGYPLLVHPQTGVIFAVASGMWRMAIALPERYYAQSLVSGTKPEKYFGRLETMRAKDRDRRWVSVEAFGDTRALVDVLCLLAYEYAGE